MIHPTPPLPHPPSSIYPLFPSERILFFSEKIPELSSSHVAHPPSSLSHKSGSESPTLDPTSTTPSCPPSDPDRTPPARPPSPTFPRGHPLDKKITTQSNGSLGHSPPSTWRKAHPLVLPHCHSHPLLQKLKGWDQHGSHADALRSLPPYVSLSRHLACSVSPEPTAPMAVDCRQLELFPLHPEPIRNRDRFPDDDREVNYASRFLDLQCDALNSILRPAVDLDQEAGPAGDLDPHGAIARVLRGRERWEFYNEEEQEEEEEEGEGSSGAGSCDAWWDAPARALSLKLDYDEIMTAWSDKGPLYVDGEGAQVVPSDPRRHHLFVPSSVFVEVGGGSNNSSSNLWAVPENCEGSGGGREARVLRYREKKRSRLFAKKIRYEVRKLNAEKRPRIKGRFVKRVE